MKKPAFKFQYKKAELERQRRAIAASCLNARERILRKAYAKVLGLTESDPPELWRFALGKCEPRVETLNEAELKRAKELGDHIRQREPGFDADVTYEGGQRFLYNLRATTLRESVHGLTTRAKDDAELTVWLSKLLDIHRRARITKEEFHRARADADLTTRLLIQNWIQDPPRENWAIASLCFFSDRAMAKLVFYLSQPRERRQWLPLEKLETEAERISKLYARTLELIPAKPRLVKDVEFKFGKVQFIPYKRAVWKGH